MYIYMYIYIYTYIYIFWKVGQEVQILTEDGAPEGALGAFRAQVSEFRV